MIKNRIAAALLVCALTLTVCACTAPQDDFLVAVGGGNVPAGVYAMNTLAESGVDTEKAAAHFTYAANVREIVTALQEGTVDCGFIYLTDAKLAGITPVEVISEELSGKVLYPAALPERSENRTAADHFLTFLQSAHAASIFRKAGFSALLESDALPDASQDEGTLNVFAAASLRETMTELAEAYKELAPQVELVFTFDASGTLRTQIEQGAVCDLFLSASKSEVDVLWDEGLCDMRCNLLENGICLCVSESSDCAIASLQELCERLK